MTVVELLRDPSRWTQGEYARNAQGRWVVARSPHAVCWCLVGAVEYCYSGDERVAAYERLRRALKFGRLTEWNDVKDRTHAQVVELALSARV